VNLCEHCASHSSLPGSGGAPRAGGSSVPLSPYLVRSVASPKWPCEWAISPVWMPHAVGRSSSHNVATYFTAFAVSETGAALGAYYVSFANEVRRRTSFSSITERTSLWSAMLSPSAFSHACEWTVSCRPRSRHFLLLLASRSTLPAYHSSDFPLPRHRDQNLSRLGTLSRYRPSNNYTHS
jgi:hypothetical protein